MTRHDMFQNIWRHFLTYPSSFAEPRKRSNVWQQLFQFLVIYSKIGEVRIKYATYKQSMAGFFCAARSRDILCWIKFVYLLIHQLSGVCVCMQIFYRGQNPFSCFLYATLKTKKLHSQHKWVLSAVWPSRVDERIVLCYKKIGVENFRKTDFGSVGTDLSENFAANNLNQFAFNLTIEVADETNSSRDCKLSQYHKTSKVLTRCNVLD